MLLYQKPGTGLENATNPFVAVIPASLIYNDVMTDNVEYCFNERVLGDLVRHQFSVLH
jgi:hypothetical protein